MLLSDELIEKMVGDADTMALVAASRVFGLSSEQFLHCLGTIELTAI
jgi:hypothetical protein